MTSAFNQIDFDQFIKTLSVAEIQTLIIQYEELMSVKFEIVFISKLSNDLYLLKKEMLNRFSNI